MPFPVYTPRVNNNEDEARLVLVWVEPGTFVKAGAPVVDIETDKATFAVEAERDGFVLQLCGTVGAKVKVGDVLFWMGDRADEAPPVAASSTAPGEVGTNKAPTLRAAALMAEYGIDACRVAAAADRITAADVERHLASHPGRRAEVKAGIRDGDRPSEPGQLGALDPQRHGMLRTVSWQRDHAVPGYVEIAFPEGAWNRCAAQYQARNKLLLSPLLALIAWKLVQAVKERPTINATIVGEEQYVYSTVNLGFPVQRGADLYVVVVRSAETMDEGAFIGRLGELQRSAMKRSLKPDETQGATIGFSSMARWQATRHIPVLLPYTSLMVAHATASDGRATIGATYDHRVLNGAEVAQTLQRLVQPVGKETP
jgi:pyruvate dehydrogenase E2 component (dihydrolipoamide acetyltransferase)